MREYIIETANAFDFVVVWLIATLAFHLFSFDGWVSRKRALDDNVKLDYFLLRQMLHNES